MGQRKAFTENEDRFIKEHRATTPDRVIAEQLGRTVKSIRRRSEKLGIPPKKIVRRWSEKEDQIILSSNGRKLNDVAADLGRDPSDVSKRARKLGIENWKRRDGSPYIDGHGYIVDHFDKGTAKQLHRKVVEESIGRPLRHGEVVHHINLDRRDNRKENLHMFPSPREHALCHNSLRKLVGKDMSGVADAIRMGTIVFDRDGGTYQCGNLK